MSIVSERSFADAFDPEVYGNGDPTTFGLPLGLYERMRNQAPIAPRRNCLPSAARGLFRWAKRPLGWS